MDLPMNWIVEFLVAFATDLLIPLMLVGFLLGGFIRILIYFTVRCEFRFSQEFEKRAHKHLANEDKLSHELSFHDLTAKILHNTYYEHFELKRKYRRRRLDNVTCLTDRIFLIQEGAARLVKDTLKQTKYLKKGQDIQPQFHDIAKFCMNSNPAFNKILGIFPMGLFNDVLNILPGLFVIGGIFGTFLGVMRALPELGGMDVADVSSSKAVIDTFLVRISFSMSTSIIGIICSVGMTVFNAVLAPDSLYIDLVNKWRSSLEFLWNDSHEDLYEYEQSEDKRLSPRRIERPFPFREFLSEAERSHREASGRFHKARAQDPKQPVVAEEQKPTGLSGFVFKKQLEDSDSPSGLTTLEEQDPAIEVPQDEVDIDVSALEEEVDLNREEERRLQTEAKEQDLDPSMEEQIGEHEDEDEEISAQSGQEKVERLNKQIDRINLHIKKILLDKEEGLISEATWKEKNEQFLLEKQQLEESLTKLQIELKAKRVA